MKAFPITSTLDNNNGMDLRDYFAAKVMQGMLASDLRAHTEQYVAKAYEIADAMMEARK